MVGFARCRLEVSRTGKVDVQMYTLFTCRLRQSRSYERQRLNERPIFLRSHLYFLAIVESILHLYYDRDDVSPPRPTLQDQGTDLKGTQKAIPPVPFLKKNIFGELRGAISHSLMLSLPSLVLYYLFFRNTAWTWGLSLARIFWSIPKTVGPPSFPPYHYSLIFRSFTSGFLLLSLWRISNLLFTTYVTQEPLKRCLPLTHQSSDPNGSLLNGLKSKRGLIRVSL